MSLGDSCIKRVRNRIAILSMLAVVLEYSYGVPFVPQLSSVS